MKRIPFPTESYQAASSPVSQKRLVNYYAEPQPDDSRSPVILRPTPGLIPFTDMVFGAGPVVALNTDRPGAIYAASGTHFYRASSPFLGPLVVQDLGSISSISLADYPHNVMVTVAAGINSVVVVVPPNAYAATDAGGLNQLAGTFPGATSVAYLHGYHVFTASNFDSGFFITKLLDPTSVDALDFAYADAVPNIVRRVMVLRDELWFFGERAIEVWYNSGDADFPFRRRTSALITPGAVSPRTIALLDNSLWWVGLEGHVYRSSGYQAKLVSTPPVEDALRVVGLDANTAIYAFAYEQGAHSFFVLTIGNRTFCYDVATKAWHERATGDTNSAWAPTCAGALGFAPLFGMANTGQVMVPDPLTDTEGGATVPRLVQLPPLWADTRRAFAGRLEIEAEVGLTSDPPSMLLQWSDDGGYTWSTGRTISISRAGAYRQRLVATRLGSFRQRMFRLVINGGRTTLYGVDADIAAGAS